MINIIGIGIFIGSGVSRIFLDFIIAVGDVFLDNNYVYGYEPQQYVGGDVTIDITGALTTSVSLIYFLDVTQPSFTVVGGVADVVENGDFVEGVLNIIRISYDGTDVIVSYNAEL